MIALRSMTARDLPRLRELDTSFESDAVLELHRAGVGLEVHWSLVERRLAAPEPGRCYDLLASDLRELGRRLAAGQGLYLVAEEEGRIVGALDLERTAWNNTAWLWNLLVDRPHRRRGIGRRLFGRAVEYCRRRRVRAILIETQSNNLPACRFYAALGCELAGLNEALYSNQDVERNEVALFWAYRVDDDAPGAPWLMDRSLSFVRPLANDGDLYLS